MENPATWGKAERVVDKAIKDHQAAWDERPPRIGLSQVRCITDALREAGLLKEEPDA